MLLKLYIMVEISIWHLCNRQWLWGRQNSGEQKEPRSWNFTFKKLKVKVVRSLSWHNWHCK